MLSLHDAVNQTQNSACLASTLSKAHPYPSRPNTLRGRSLSAPYNLVLRNSPLNKCQTAKVSFWVSQGLWHAHDEGSKLVEKGNYRMYAQKDSVK